MKMIAKCDLCEFEVIKNGNHKTYDAIENHCRTEHEKEFKEKVAKDRKIMRQIIELEKTAIRLWKMDRFRGDKHK